MQWIENYIRPSVKMRTYERYKLIVEQHIKDKIGGMDMNDLSPFVLQQFITELLQSGNKKTGKGLSANSVNAVISVLQSSLRTALLLGLTKEYTADKLKRPKLQEKSVECFTIAEQKQIEKAVMNGKKDKLYGILLCLYSGLRIGELIALQWSDIDLTKGILTVSKSCHDSKDGLIIDAPKTISSRRAIYERCGNLKFKYRNREFWCKGYYVDSVGKNTEKIKEYIENQLKEDKLGEQLRIDYPESGFKA